MRLSVAAARGALAGLVLVAAAGGAQAAPKIHEVTSPGGITAWLVNEPSVPVISMAVRVEGGSAYDPADRPGMAQMLSGLMTEGAGDLDAVAYNLAVEKIAASISYSMGEDHITADLRTLSRNRDEAFRLFALTMAEPRFDADAVERVRGQALASLRRDQEDASWRARRQFEETMLAGHPYASQGDGTVEGLQAITADGLKEAARQRFARDRLTIGVVGDIMPDELAGLLDRTFGALPATSDLGGLPEWQPTDVGGVKVVEMDFPQSQIVFGLPGLKRDDPDWYAAYVLNIALGGGGGLTSRLATEVREKRGLAYSVYTYLMPRDHAGIWIGAAGTRNDRVVETLDVIRAVMANVRENGLTPEELADAKTFANGSFPLNLTSSGRIADLLVAMQEHGLGIDHMERRAALIDAVDAAAVKRVAERLLHPGRLLFAVAGKPAGIGG